MFVTCENSDDLPYVVREGGEDCLVIGTDYGHTDTSSDLDAGSDENKRGRTKMSVIMLQRAKGDPDRLEEYAAQNPEGIKEIIALAKEHGLIAHRFYGSEGQILIADEWPDEESFVRFAEAAQSRIGLCSKRLA
jgi:hypothetical protein